MREQIKKNWEKYKEDSNAALSGDGCFLSVFRPVQVIIAIILIICLISTGVSRLFKDKSEYVQDYKPDCFTEEEWRVLFWTNEYRVCAGKQPLAMTEALNECASTRAAEILHTPSHTRPNGDAFSTAYNSVAARSAENLAVGYYDPEAAVTVWMASPGHRESVLNQVYHKNDKGEYVTSYGEVITATDNTTINDTSRMVIVDSDEIGTDKEYAYTGIGRKESIWGMVAWIQYFAGGVSQKSNSAVPSSIEVSKQKVTVPCGTNINDMCLYVIAHNDGNDAQDYGTGYMPLLFQMCTGYDENKLGDQVVTVTWQGVSTTFTVSVTPEAGQKPYTIFQMALSLSDSPKTVYPWEHKVAQA